MSISADVPLPSLASAAGLARGACVLQETVAHPQGGGQPGDCGLISLSPSLVFVFHTARKAVGAGVPLPPSGDVVLHLGVWCAVAAATEGQDGAGTCCIDYQELVDGEGGPLASPLVRPHTREEADAALDSLLLSTSSDGNEGRGGNSSSNYSDVSGIQRLGHHSPCHVFISAPQRRLNARMHSAGHLLDLAVRRVLVSGVVSGAPPALVAARGYHFPDGPWVEYSGSLDAAVLAPFKAAVSTAAAAALLADEPTRVVELPAGDSAACAAAGLAPTDTAHLAPGTAIRVVAVGDAANTCPCGGTHVKNAGEIGKLTLTKVTSKKGVVRVSYVVE